MKLKTLREIWVEHIKENPDSRRALEYQTRLKLEAIKWWKAIENGDVENTDCQGFIKWVFNLEDANLKTGEKNERRSN